MFAEADQEDVIEKFRPVTEWRKLLRDDPEQLEAACKLWQEVAGEIIFYSVSHSDEFQVQQIPYGFNELSHALAWWCDAGPFSIDPIPITDGLRASLDIAGNSRVRNLETVLRANEALGDAFVQSHAVFHRMLYCAFAAVGKDAPAVDPRLPIITLKDGAATILFDGQKFSNVDHDAAFLLQVLVDNYPLPKGLSSDDYPKPERQLKNLPPEILDRVRTIGKKGRVLHLDGLSNARQNLS